MQLALGIRQCKLTDPLSKRYCKPSRTALLEIEYNQTWSTDKVLKLAQDEATVPLILHTCATSCVAFLLQVISIIILLLTSQTPNHRKPGHAAARCYQPSRRSHKSSGPDASAHTRCPWPGCNVRSSHALCRCAQESDARCTVTVLRRACSVYVILGCKHGTPRVAEVLRLLRWANPGPVESRRTFSRNVFKTPRVSWQARAGRSRHMQFVP